MTAESNSAARIASSARRLAAVETSLGSTELVLHILAEAQTFDSLENYTRSVIDQPEEAAPLSRIAATTEARIRTEMKGASREAVDAAVRRAIGDGFFTFLLVLHLNGAALEIARIEGLRASAAFFWMGCLLGGPREQDLAPKEWAEHKKEQTRAWHSWRLVVAGLLATLTIEDDARERLETRYLNAQPSLLADAAREWARFADMVDHLGSLAEKLAPLTGAEERRLSKDSGQKYDRRVQERARKLADDARISTFDRLGENSRALAILERRLDGEGGDAA
jgi:hypothetical protein